MSRKTGFILFVFLCSFWIGIPVQAEGDRQENFELNEQLLEEISLDAVEDYWETLASEYGGYIPNAERTSFIDIVKNLDSLSFKEIALGLLDFLFHELIYNGKLLGSLLLLTIFSIILQTMHAAFEKSTVSKIAYFIVFLVLIFIALSSFYTVITYAKQTIDTMSSFMIGLLPLILGLMATFGNVFAVSFFHPIIIFLIHFTGVFISFFALPLLSFAALLIIISSISENYKVTNLANLLRSITVSSLGVLLTVFLGVMSVQGAASAVQDGVAMRTAKFITGNFIPVIGRTFTDAADTILTATLLLKNSLGIVGLLIILLICLFPAIKILVIAFIYRVAAAVLEPLGKGPIITTLQALSTYILYVLACLLAVSFMFLLAIVLIVAASNLTLLLR
ncbi:stage III sporulation protein AE [Oceanobacillus sp. AG]|uniref:stage III sporulation protein AE n=1 Tax=Oceanobacillus sp. AG TaxID=2681969 RepID=UPI0012EB2F96|nr:stage III sporulation protein AE [Oceanobacillus sp. AG]